MIGIFTSSYGIVGATGALARYPDLPILFLIDNEGPASPGKDITRGLRNREDWAYRISRGFNKDLKPDSDLSDEEIASLKFKGSTMGDIAYWDERDASIYASKIPCPYLRLQGEIDHAQGKYKYHMMAIINAATEGRSPWTRCNDNPPNIIYRESELSKYHFPSRSPNTPRFEKIISGYIKEMFFEQPWKNKGLDDSPFGFLELFEPYEAVSNGKIKNRCLIRGLAKPGPDGQLPRTIDAEVFFEFIGRNAQELGVRWTRSDVSGGLWRRIIEVEKGSYNWLGADTVIMAAKKRGFHTLVRISPGTVWDLEPEAKGYSGAKFPTDIDGYRRFVRLGVERYDGDGVDDAPGSPRVDCWQIHNEPDGPGFWDDTPEKFAEFYRITYKEIKAADPDAIICPGGCATHQGIERFYAAFLADLGRDGKRWFDFADFHFNQAWFWPSEQGDYHGLIRAVKDFRTLLDRNGFDYAPIWITECGSYSGQPPAGGPFDEGQRGLSPAITEREHAVDLVKRYILAISLGVKKIFWTGMLERFAEAGDGYFAHTGLIYDGRFDPPGVKFGDRKLAFYAYKKMIEVLEGSNWKNVETIQEKDGIYIYKFTRNNKPIWVAWNDAPKEKQIAISGITSNQVKITEAVPKYESGKDVTDYNTAFETETKTVVDGQIIIKLKNNPVFVGVSREK